MIEYHLKSEDLGFRGGEVARRCAEASELGRTVLALRALGVVWTIGVMMMTSVMSKRNARQTVTIQS